MDVRKPNFANDFCHGCLSFGRRCSTDSENSSLFYQLLDPFNISKEPINLILCWECEATLKRIRIFQFKANKAQACLQDVIAHTFEHKSLSTLTSTTKNIYDHTIDAEVPETLPSSSEKDEESKPTIKKLKSSDCQILKVPIKVKGLNSNIENGKINNCNNDIENTTQEHSEKNIEDNTSEEKFTDKKYALENPEIFKLKDLKVVIKKANIIAPALVIKEEPDDYYSDDNFLADDHITLDVTAKEIKSELLLENVHKKRKKSRIQRDRAKKTAIDYNNVKKYFTKRILSTDALRKQLTKWPKEKKLKYYKYKCRDCVIVFNSKAEERNHIELHKNKTDLKCSLCCLSFNSDKELASHKDSHEFYQCDICLFVCGTLNSREEHLRECHRRGYWQCDQCILSFSVQTELTAHKEKLHRTFICDYCNAKRYTKQTIQKHIIANHIRIKQKCHLCERTFTRRYQLRQHLIDSHNIPGLSNASKESTYCVECNKQYNSMAKYKKHLRASIVHTPKKKVLVPCPTCGKTFTKKTYLNNHYKLFHGGGTKHRCDPCNKCYSSAYGLRMHLLRYHKKVPMPKTKVCETCGLGFQTNRILIHHMRTHTGERPYECTYCPARFTQKYARDVHVRNVHLKHLQHFIT